MTGEPIATAEWLTIWGLIWATSLAHVAFWVWLCRDMLPSWLWWL